MRGRPVTPVVSTNEQWVPWELIFDGQAFWGEKFVVARYPRPTDDTSRLPPSVEYGGLRPVHTVVNVVGGEIPTAEGTRALQLFDAFMLPGRIRKLEEKPVAELCKALVGADLLHCTCHGYLDPHLLRVASDKSRIQNLLPETVKLLATLLPLRRSGLRASTRLDES